MEMIEATPSVLTTTTTIPIMRILLLMSLAFVAVLGVHRISDDEIDQIRSKAANWEAGRTFFTDNMDALRHRCGLLMEKDDASEALWTKLQYPPRNDLPKEFDARTKWPHCDTIKEIKDQSNCGSCWAFGTVEAISDRICISTGKNVNISAEDMFTCARGYGCKGGYIKDAYKFYTDDGVVTGGIYGSRQGCQPYDIKPCPPELPECRKLHPTPKCNKTCEAGYPKTYPQDKHFGKDFYKVVGVEQIMNEIYTKGPVTAGFLVYQDFGAYKSGVYKHVWGLPLSGHAVKIIGWGVEKGEDYWLIANSWTTNWGEKGFFKMLKGKNECGIEEHIAAAQVKKKVKSRLNLRNLVMVKP